MKLIIGFITYEEITAKYLPYFLNSLKKQSFKNYKIIAVDNSGARDNPNHEYIKKEYPQLSLEWQGGNLGFAKANNIIINKAVNRNAEYILFLNPDMILANDMLEKLVKAMDEDEKLGSASPKILKWDFSGDKRTNIIDTCGIVEIGALRFTDIGQGEEDKGQHDNAAIIGPSGAGAIYRISSLALIKGENGYFDEHMFMYKEDCDLAYRIKSAGMASRCVPDAIGYHDRTASGPGLGKFKTVLNRSTKSRQVKSWSFLNQHIIFIKHWRRQSISRKLQILWFTFEMLMFALIFEQYLLKQYIILLKYINSRKQ